VNNLDSYTHTHTYTHTHVHTHAHTHTWTKCSIKGTQSFMCDNVSTTLQSSLSSWIFSLSFPYYFFFKFRSIFMAGARWFLLPASLRFTSKVLPPHPTLPPTVVRHNCAEISTYVRHGWELGGWKSSSQIRKSIQVTSIFFVICESFCNPKSQILASCLSESANHHLYTILINRCFWGV
jgi:hypothetical protein